MSELNEEFSQNEGMNVSNDETIREDRIESPNEERSNGQEEGKKEKKGKKDKKPRRTLLSRFDLLNRFKHWYMGGISITRSIFRVRAAWQGVIIICTILAILFILAAFYTGAGEFVISLDSKMSRDGFYLSNTMDFSEKEVCIRGTAVVADNVSIFDISDDVGYVDGMHNGDNYVAHTFYLTNETGETKDYQYSLNIRQSAKNAERALWVMVYFNGKQTIYAMNGADGSAESQYSIYEFPFMEDAANTKQYQIVSGEQSGISASEISNAESISSANELITIPFESDDVVCSGVRNQIKNNEVDKFTVVMWYEGEDPECTDDIIGGWVELYMGFDYED